MMASVYIDVSIYLIIWIFLSLLAVCLYFFLSSGLSKICKRKFLIPSRAAVVEIMKPEFYI